MEAVFKLFEFRFFPSLSAMGAFGGALNELNAGSYCFSSNCWLGRVKVCRIHNAELEVFLEGAWKNRFHVSFVEEMFGSSEIHFPWISFTSLVDGEVLFICAVTNNNGNKNACTHW